MAGTKLEQEGRVRKKQAFAWACWTPFDVRSVSIGVHCAGGDEVEQEIVTSSPLEVVKDGAKRSGTRRVIETRWIPERYTRVFLPRIPEPIYQPEDLEKFTGDEWVVIRSKRDLDKYNEAMREDRERRRAAEQMALRQESERLLAEREELLRKMRRGAG